MAALQTLRRIDPEMRIKTAIAFVHAASRNGVSVKETAEAVGDTSEGSVRYALKTLGSGHTDKPGHGLLRDDAATTGRAQVYVPTAKGRTTLTKITRAMTQVRSGPELRLVA
ncbi:hypothetical protein [Microvirga massiliensis]|uniref:hypothetical protein n=1 Tax=Microvirga massiliensis TaxID=1033741 RepID=UPI00062BE26E|nr:hypothetical protein [Microvirga massiliensis]